MNIMSWGNYPKTKNQIFKFNKLHKLKKLLKSNNNLIVHGNGRSYGDSALGKKIILSRKYNYFIDFDESSGLLKLQSGVLLQDILEIFVPLGWFLKVTPGTKFVTVGGAIASDVHGKNHHIDGTFGQHVESINLVLGTGEVIVASQAENIELFHATCGGMGLTGVIISVTMQLTPIRSSSINQKTIMSY